MIQTAILLTAVLLPGGAPANPGDRLSLDEARRYMMELINQDRAALKLSPVSLDPVATAAGQKHAEDMVVGRYLAHWDRQGKLPDQRYTEEGGIHHVLENAWLEFRYERGDSGDPLTVEAAPTFARSEIEGIEEAFFNERPPYDSHRKNIVDPFHTHVGVGLARARNDRARTFGATQEFINRYLDMDAIPREARVGDKITVSGRVPAGSSFRAIAIGRGDAPASMTRDELAKTSHYANPKPFAIYRPEPGGELRPVSVTRDGRFSHEVVLSDESRPGLYYIAVWLRSESGRDFIASQRTIIVK